MKSGCFLMFLWVVVAAGFLPAAVVDDYRAFDINTERKAIFDSYSAKKTEIFARHGVPVVDGVPVKTHPAYAAAANEIVPHYEAMMSAALEKESGRTGLNKNLFRNAGVDEKAFSYSGTEPGKGRGLFGDFEGTLSPKDYDKVVKFCKENNIPCAVEGDYIRINGSDSVFHRAAGPGDKVGSSAFDARVQAQVAGAETAGSAYGQAKYQGLDGEFLKADAKGAALDSVKKMQGAVNSEPATPLDRYLNDQVLAKEANRINEAGGRPVDPRLDKVKKGMDPDLIPDLEQPVRKTAMEQTRSAWGDIEAKDRQLRSELAKKIEAAATDAERVSLRSQLKQIEQRQRGTFDTVLGKDGGRAISEVTGCEVAAAAGAEGRTAGRTVLETMKKQLPNAGDDVARTIAELEQTPAGRALLAKAGELLKVGVKGAEKAGLALMVYDGLCQTVETARKEGAVAGALKGGNVFTDFGLMLASPQYGLMRMGTDVGKVAFDAVMLGPLNNFTGQLAYDGAQGGFLVQNDLKRTELTKKYSSMEEAVKQAGEWFDRGGADVHGLYAGPEAKQRAREAFLAQVASDYRQCAAYDIARVSCSGNVVKDGYDNIFRSLNMSPAEFASRFKSREAALVAIDKYMEKYWAYTDWDRTGVGVVDARKATRNYLLEVWKDLRLDYEAAVLIKADMDKAAAGKRAAAGVAGQGGETSGNGGRSWSDYFSGKLAAKEKDRQNSEETLRAAERQTDLFGAFEYITSLYDGGRRIAGSWWDSFFGSAEEKKRSAFDAVQGGADAVLNERRLALEAARNRAEGEFASRDVDMQSWLSSLTAAYESARAEARYQRENSWAAWTQSLLLDTARGAFGGFGTGFGGRLGSGIVEHEIMKRWPRKDDAGKGKVPDTSKPDGSSGTKKEEKSSGGTAVSDPAPPAPDPAPTPPGPAPTPPPASGGTTTIRTIDGRPFQPPPDGRNTSNEITLPPKAATPPPAPAHWFCMHCGTDLGVSGSGSCPCKAGK